VTQCFEDLGKPDITFDTFWDVYRELRELVDTAVPDDLVVALSESFRDDTDGAPEPFALAHMKEPELRGIGVDLGENEGIQDGALFVDFTIEEDRDQLF